MSIDLFRNLSGREMGAGRWGDGGTRRQGAAITSIHYSLFPIPYPLSPIPLLTATAFEENHHQNAEDRLQLLVIFESIDLLNGKFSR
jgi:hypothetical protein